MQSFPFELTILRSGDGGRETVLCRKTLRAIANNREVLDAQWKDKSIVVKVFSRGFWGRRRLKREWEGLTKLRNREVSAPQPLFYGKTQDRRWAIATGKIAEAASLKDVYKCSAEKEQRLNLLLKLSRELAGYHEKGIFQKDLHLGNFLLNADKITVLDAGQIRFTSRPIGRRKSISQLALLTTNFNRDEADCTLDVWRGYFNQRKWRFEEADERLLWEQTAAHKKNWTKKALKKCLRTSKKFLRIRTAEYLAVFDKGFCESAEPNNFVQRIDELTDKGQILKRGNTSSVSRLTWNGKEIVIKRYNYKGFFHSLRHTIKGSRARRSWLYGHRLTWLGIPTPKPLACIEKRKGPLIWNSYLVTEFVDGENLHNYLRDEKNDAEKRSAAMQQVLEMVEKLQKSKITHRDLKQTNILVTADGPMLTDLDAMKVHKLGWICKSKSRRYIERFRQGLRETAV
jgi:tRNA A-37 threonylcarbamoyl transferase component Bud32